jgi:hypothetical protein
MTTSNFVLMSHVKIAGEGGAMGFEDFLDMMSIMGESAPVQVVSVHLISVQVASVQVVQSR